MTRKVPKKAYEAHRLYTGTMDVRVVADKMGVTVKRARTWIRQVNNRRAEVGTIGEPVTAPKKSS